MEEFVFDPAEYLGSADCIKHLPVLSRKHLISCAQWLGVPLKSVGTKREILMAVRDKISQDLAEAENLVSERREDSDDEDSMFDADSEEEKLSVRAGLTLFEDPPRTGIIFEGPSNLLKANLSTNPFLPSPNPTPEGPLAPIHALGESKEEVEYKLICKRIELRKLEFEENERARRHELEVANINLQMARLQGTNMISSLKNNFNDKFNLGAALKLVPVFDEKNVPEFFKALERVATRLSWPSEMWTVLIQCRLVGKAIRVYNALEEGIAWDYQKVKALVLKAYDLVPEAYRLKFRNYNKHPSQSFVEFARVKEEQFDDWLKSRQVVSFAALRELLLLEEFKKACSKELRVHLEEVKAIKLSNAAQLADEYVLTHRSGTGNFGYQDMNNPSSRVFSNGRRVETISSVSNIPKGNNDHSFTGNRKVSGVSGGPPPPRVFVNRDMPNSGNNNYNRPNDNRGTGRRVTCYWCDKPGHFQHQCNARRRYLQRNGKIIHKSKTINVKFLRDTGSARSLVLSEALNGLQERSGNFVVLGGFLNTVVSAPLVDVRLSFPGYDRVTELAVVDNLPIPGIDGILGNDMLNSEGQELFLILSVQAHPVSVTTRATARAAESINDDELLFSSLEVDVERPGSVDSSDSHIIINDVLKPDWDRLAFIEAQKKEFNFELGDINDLTKPQFGIIHNLLYRFSRPSTDDLSKTSRIEQIVVPSQFRESVMSLAHDNFLSCHFGVWKTFRKLARYFWWPGMKSSVKRFVNECEVCQVMGKPNQIIPEAPLNPIPAIGEPFSELVIDVVGPLPKTKSGYIYLLTIMDRASRFPEAFPLRRITSKVVFEKLMEFFSRYGLPRVIQTDCGTNFTSKMFRGIIPMIFGHKVRGPLDIFCEVLGANRRGDFKMGEFVDDLRKRMFSAWKFARDNLNYSQAKMKANFDRNAKARSFEPGELVLILSMDSDNFLEPRYKGPWKVLRKLSEVNYEIEAPGSSRKCKIFHVNRLKAYHSRSVDPLTVVSEPVSVAVEFPPQDSDDLMSRVSSDALFSNIQNLEVLQEGLKHLDPHQREDIFNLIYSFSDLFRDSPGRTNFLWHDVDVGSASPVKQSPYRLNPVKRDLVEKEIKYMLEHDLIQPSVSPWSSPIVLVGKADGKFRMCVDYRKVNAHTKNDSFPLPHIDDCLDQIGFAKFITKLDLLKGYWQVPLSDRAREISAFVTPFGLYECKVMPFGMKNAACTFQRLMNRVICGLKGTEIYIDDLVVYSNDWSMHMLTLSPDVDLTQSSPAPPP
ncbi:uncharacterized protein [Macrobrachium rosenbergii]|uniref:uncharacterized protein n=1 Tax=Macrobrachium rosenbergii TaxID=79674 RepID=UPI0034D60257